MSKDTLRYYFQYFCQCIKALHGESFLNRLPTKAELQIISKKYGKHGFYGCIGCVDGCKINWKNCPGALKRQYPNTQEWKLALIAVEAGCDKDLYMWYWFAGHCGTNNHKTLLEVSPLSVYILNVKYNVELPKRFKPHKNVHRKLLAFFFIDGMYLQWTIFASPIHDPSNECKIQYTKTQEVDRRTLKDHLVCYKHAFMYCARNRASGEKGKFFLWVKHVLFYTKCWYGWLIYFKKMQTKTTTLWFVYRYIWDIICADSWALYRIKPTDYEYSARTEWKWGVQLG